MLPSVELHSHIEGCVPPALALKIAKRNGISIAKERLAKDNSTYLYKGFLDFIDTYDNTVAAIIKKPQDYYDIMFYYLKQNAQQGVIYLETIYAPQLAEQSTGIPSIEHIYALEQAIRDAEHQFGIVSRLLISLLRHLGKESAEQVVLQTLKENRPHVVGVNLTGDEINYPPEHYVKAFQMAHAGGLKCTAHAGEFGDATSVIRAIQLLHVERIGHGVQSIHSQEALDLIKEKKITLEICPSSNVCLGLYKSIAEHPVSKFKELHIPMCLNSDDPPFFQTTVAHEYQKVQDTFHYSDEEMLSFTRYGIEAAFVDEATKQKLREKLTLTV